jgi:integral membrane protein
MDQAPGPKTATALRRLRLVSAPEAVSFLLLLVGSVLRRTTDFDPVPVLGALHGVLFLAYAVLWLDAWHRTRWEVKTAAWYFLMAVLPTGGFFAERRLRAAEARPAGAGTDAPPADAGPRPAAVG